MYLFMHYLVIVSKCSYHFISLLLLGISTS